jgi:CheY-like chemotaxis protein
MTFALVIDDSRQFANAMCEMLSLLQIEARAAYSPREAMSVLGQSLSPDIVFVDISMPGVDGFEVMAFLRREPRLTHVPMVVVSSDDQKETIARSRRAGAIAFIAKPVTLEALERALKRAKLR